MARGLGSETENTMSNSISTLLLRNLSDVFGENDPMRRRAAINDIFHIVAQNGRITSVYLFFDNLP
jgi:hypothetical protein